MEQKTTRHWLTVVACCGLSASAIGIGANSVGVFFTPVSEALGVGHGAFAMNSTLALLATGFSGPLVAALLRKFSLKLLLTFGILLTAAATAAMAFSTELWLFYVLGIVRGVGMAFYALVPITTVIGNWFEKKHGLAVGIALSFSGLAGAIFNPIIAFIIDIGGWQNAFLYTSLFLLVLALPGALFVLRLQPAEVSLLPYGAKTTPAPVSTEALPSQRFQKSTGVLCSLPFFIMAVFVVLHNAITGVGQHFPGYAQSLGMSAEIGATMVSAGMVGNIITKLIIGVLSDRFGAYRACSVMVISNILALTLLFFLPPGLPFLCFVAAFFYGAVYSVGAVGIPLLTRQVFGMEQYASAYSVITVLCNVGAALPLSLIGFIYDVFGNYNVVLIGSIAFGLVNLCLIQVLAALKARKQRNSRAA